MGDVKSTAEISEVADVAAAVEATEERVDAWFVEDTVR